MKTIAIVSTGNLPLPPVKGGAVENLVQLFIDINEQKNVFKIIVFTIAPPINTFNLTHFNNTEYIFINSNSFSYRLGRGIRFVINKLFKNCIKNQFLFSILKHQNKLNSADLVLIENNPFYASYLKKYIYKPLGLHLHNDYLNKDNLSVSRKILDSLDFVIGVSNHIKNRVLEIAPSSCNVSMVYNGLNLERFNSNNVIKSETLMNKFGINKGEIVIIFAGRLQESKGIKILIESFLEIKHTHKVKLIIVGSSGFSDSRKSKFIKHLQKLCEPIKDQIIFTGYVEYTEIHNYYNIADLAIFPSIGPEAFSLTTIEALASGLPVIISDSGGMPETITLKCGIIIKRGPEMKENLKKAISKLIADRALRELMSNEAKMHSTKFNEYNYFNELSTKLKSQL